MLKLKWIAAIVTAGWYVFLFLMYAILSPVRHQLGHLYAPFLKVQDYWPIGTRSVAIPMIGGMEGVATSNAANAVATAVHISIAVVPAGVLALVVRGTSVESVLPRATAIWVVYLTSLLALAVLVSFALWAPFFLS